MEGTMEKDERGEELVFGSFTTAVGLALGELLLLAGKPKELAGCLAAINTAAAATLLSSDVRIEASPTSAKSLRRAALQVVIAWHERTSFDLSDVAEAISVLKGTLEGMGVLHSCSVPEVETLVDE